MLVLFDLTSRLKKKFNCTLYTSNIAAIIICLINNIKIVIRNSENPIYSTYYSENFINSYIIFLKVIFYNLCSCIITNSVGSKNSLKNLYLIRKRLKRFTIHI